MPLILFGKRLECMDPGLFKRFYSRIDIPASHLSSFISHLLYSHTIFHERDHSGTYSLLPLLFRPTNEGSWTPVREQLLPFCDLSFAECNQSWPDAWCLMSSQSASIGFAFLSESKFLSHDKPEARVSNAHRLLQSLFFRSCEK